MEANFEKATREKWKFKVSNGVIFTQDLWDLKLEDLDKVAKALDKEINDSSEKSFIATKSKANAELDGKFAVVLHIIKVKQDEKEAKTAAAAKASQKASLDELIKRKEQSELEGMSLEDLKKMRESL
jgi:hypothetical protein